MLEDILDLVLSSAENSFLQVGVFVGGMLLIFGLINYRTRGGFVRMLGANRRWQPVFGALLGLTPGCGGAIFVMPLFIRNTVTFGTVVATLITTAGDSAFVLIAAQPLYAAITYAVCFAAGVASGYVIDAAGLGRRLGCIEHCYEEAAARHAEIEQAIEAPPAAPGEVLLSRDLPHFGHEEGDAIDMAIHHRRPARGLTLGHWITHHAYFLYWAIVAVGLVLGVLLLFQVDVNQALGIPKIGTVIGIGGIILSIVLLVAGHTFLADDSLEEQEHKLFSFRETLVHNAGDTAFATTWVFVAYVAYELLVYGLGGGSLEAGEEKMASLMQAAGLTAVIVAAAIGLIPGCGPQIILVALFTKGMIPFSALLANAISQDGDALFPLIAMNRRSALWATIVTTIPALILGVLAYYSGIDALLAGWLPVR